MSWKTMVIIIVIAGVAGATYYMGYWSERDVSSAARKTEQRIKNIGKKQTGTVAGAQKCRDNLKSIENAKRAIAAKTGAVSGPVSLAAVRNHLGGVMPKCPDGGAYTINALGMNCTCSVGTNRTPDKADDHSIFGY